MKTLKDIEIGSKWECVVPCYLENAHTGFQEVAKRVSKGTVVTVVDKGTNSVRLQYRGHMWDTPEHFFFCFKKIE